MGSYGPNFNFRISPHPQDRLGQFCTGDTAMYVGTPVVGTGEYDAGGCEIVEYAAEDAAKPLPGRGGILVYEVDPNFYRGYDADLTTPSDVANIAPAGKAVQVVRGQNCQVELTNTAESVYLNSRTYPEFVMVAGLGATSSVAVGDYLTPNDATDDPITNGFWKETADAANGWLVVVSVDPERDQLVAQLNF
jgi:hypothetical protein